MHISKDATNYSKGSNYNPFFFTSTKCIYMSDDKH